MNDIDRVCKEAVMREAEQRFTRISQEVAEALTEVEKDITIRYLSPEKLRERISRN